MYDEKQRVAEVLHEVGEVAAVGEVATDQYGAFYKEARTNQKAGPSCTSTRRRRSVSCASSTSSLCRLSLFCTCSPSLTCVRLAEDTSESGKVAFH